MTARTRNLMSTLLVGSLVASVLGGVVGCSREPAASPKPTPTSSSGQRGEPDHTYVVRGRIEMLPEASKPTSEFLVHHEAIPEFVNFNGTKGMDSMTMPFPLGKGVDLSGLKVADVVEITFVVWMTPGQRGFEVRGLKKLPGDTELTFGKVSDGESPKSPASTPSKHQH